MPFDNLDFNLEALFLWIRFTLVALSKAEKTACKSFVALLVLTFLIADFKASSRFLLRAVRVLSFRTFLIADRMIGMLGIVSQASIIKQVYLL